MTPKTRKLKILELKKECKRLAEEGVRWRQIINKSKDIERYEAWDQKRDVGADARIHYIAYCLLRGRDYGMMEPKIDDQGDTWAPKMRAQKVARVLQSYCMEEERELWTKEHIESILKAAAEVRSSGR